LWQEADIATRRDMNRSFSIATDTSVPDALLPEQYFERLAGSTREMPEKRLMAAVLLDALVQLQREGSASAAEVRAWIAGRGAGLFSFANVCEALGLDAAYLARGLAQRPRVAPRRVRLVRRRIRVGGRRRWSG
jgi:hypothetical protein